MEIFTPTKQNSKLFLTSLLVIIFFCFSASSFAQGIKTGVTFNWKDTQTTNSDPATLDYITINGIVYSTFVVPSSYELNIVGPGGHSINNIFRDGTNVVSGSNSANWNSEAILAYQSLNLNYYFQADNNGEDFCNDPSQVATTNAQVQTINYSPGIPSNPDGILAVTERAGNNCLYIEMYGIPAGGGSEQLLGSTFINNGNHLGGPGPQSPPNTATSDYWHSGRVTHIGSPIGVALYELSSIAPVGSTITSIKYLGATTDHGDGKFFLMQTYAVDDTFNPDFETIFHGDVGANDNVPAGSNYSYHSSVPPFNGTLVVNSDGTFSYTPDPGFTGTDVFEVQVCLPAPNSSVCNTSTVTLNIKPGVTIDNASAEEGNNMTFTISINDPSDTDINFNLSYTNNTTTNADYTGPSTITLPANASSVTFDVAALDDDWFENNQTFNVTFTDPNNSTTAINNTGVGTIIDTDKATVSTGNYDIIEDAGTIQLRVFLSPHEGAVGVEEEFTVDFSTIGDERPITWGGTATKGSDYIETITTITFPANSPVNTEFFVPLQIIDDDITEPSEQIRQNVNNSSISGVGIAGSGMVRIHDNDTATIILEDRTVNEAVGTFNYTFILDGEVQYPFDITYNTSDNTATSPNDFNAVGTTTLNFTGTDGETETVSLTITNDTSLENSENFHVNPSYTGVLPTTPTTNAVAANIIFSRDPAVITITDDENATIALSATNSTEGNAVIFTATLSTVNNTGTAITVDFADLTTGSATSGTDYTAVPVNATITIANGATTGTINIPTTQDSVIEGNETIIAQISNVSYSGVTISSNSATAIINDDDNAAPGDGIAFSNVTISEDEGNVAADNVTLTFNVTYSGTIPAGETVSVDYSTVDGTALDASDYESNSGTLQFTSGNQATTIVVQVTEDTNIEADENFTVLLNNITTANGFTTGFVDRNSSNSATGNINNDDNAGAGDGIAFSQAIVNTLEGNVAADNVTLTFNVTYSGTIPAGETVSVDYTTVDGTALDTSDYESNSGTLQFTSGNQASTIVVQVTEDTNIESDENFTVLLNNITTANGFTTGFVDGNSSNSATGNINNDDNAGAGDGIAFSSVTISEDEGNVAADNVSLTFNVTYSGTIPAGETVSVDYTTVDGTAIDASDYESNSGTLQFTSGNQVTTIVVQVTEDTNIESDENFTVLLNNITTANGFTTGFVDGNSSNSATGNINNDDNAGAGDGIAFSSVTISEDEGNVAADNVSLTFNVTYSGTIPAGETVSVDYSTVDGTALDASDYESNSGTLQFTSGNQATTIVVQVTEDTNIESDENFTVLLNNITTANGFTTGFVDGNSSNSATGNINNDDNAGAGDGIAFSNVTISEDEGNVAADNVSLTFNVTYSGTIPAGETVSVDYSTVDGTALDASDYESNSGTLQFTSGNQATTIVVQVTEDTNIEADENFTVLLNNITTANGFTTGFVDGNSSNSATGNINNDDSNAGDGIQFTQTEVIVTEGTDDYAIFNVTLTGNIGENVTVDYTTAVGTAISPNDFTETSGTITFEPTVKSFNIQVPIIDDILVENQEQFTVVLSNIVSNIGIEFVNGQPTNTATGTINDNDSDADFPNDETVSCDTIPAIETIVLNAKDCAYTVDVVENITGQDDSCPSEYTITRTWTVTDCVGNIRTHTQTITVEDTTAPTFVEILPQNITVTCNAVPDAEALTIADNCDANATVTYNETATNDRNCSTGYIITRTWTAQDCAGNENTHTQTITIEPTGPITASNYDQEITITCGEDIPEVPALEFMGGCGDFNVVFTEEEQFSTDTDDYMIVRTWNVTDSCDNMETFEQIIFVMQPQEELITIDICIEDSEIDLINYLPESFDINGFFEVISRNATLNGSYFDPINFEVGEYIISYSSIDTSCKFYAEYTINVNADCVPCGVKDIAVSKAVTVNGDGINDLFTITGVENCDFEFHVLLFNRWGKKVFESENYENDWGGFAPNGSFGKSGVLPAGTYYYIINITNRELKPINGYIYLGTE
ncbi:Calx-beta domain-containing protein [uncultured Maribacter sp.]|uniref:Calx-beta domain-containing protein n=1 Tax=uncultured Maribacter sp. TaxID=431308 RepID=UPI00260C15DE|nr:Calx-beta domain-containing protein [uncultured Maribacter sp.]